MMADKEPTEEAAFALAAQRALQRARRTVIVATDPRSARRPWTTRSTTGQSDSADSLRPVAHALEALVDSEGWTGAAAQARIHEHWSSIVGPDVAEHSQPGVLSEGVLSISATSTAWATQLRLLSGELLARITDLVGPGQVSTLSITGPRAPSWRSGLRSVPGRGPRDTYG